MLTWVECAGLQTRYDAYDFTGLKVAGSWLGKSFKNKTKIQTFLQYFMTKCFCYRF